MEHISLKGLTRLENNVVIINNASLKQLVDYIGVQTTAINMLIDELNDVKSELKSLRESTSINTTNIKTIATALKGVYSNE